MEFSQKEPLEVEAPDVVRGQPLNRRVWPKWVIAGGLAVVAYGVLTWYLPANHSPGGPPTEEAPPLVGPATNVAKPGQVVTSSVESELRDQLRELKRQVEVHNREQKQHAELLKKMETSAAELPKPAPQPQTAATPAKPEPPPPVVKPSVAKSTVSQSPPPRQRPVPPVPTVQPSAARWMLDMLQATGCSPDWLSKAMKDNGLSETGTMPANPRIKLISGCAGPAPDEVAAESKRILAAIRR